MSKKTKPVERDDLMERAKAYKCLADSIVSPKKAEQFELEAFMKLIHPDFAADAVRMAELRKATRG